MIAVIPLILFVVAFVVRAVQSGLEAEDYVLWMLAGLAAMTVAPAIALVKRRRPARIE